MDMTDSFDVKIARLEEKLVAIEQKVDFNAQLATTNDVRAQANDEIARIHNAEVLGKLTSLISITDEWRGVRKALSTMGAILVGCGAIAGGLAHYLWNRVP